ncbi:MAG: hypothetical protein HQM09_12770 [Candidatus Riflebacteria bacterium]|nr:hypothetical protein [Candidatus Riflebacteria bacterium]
MLTFPRHLLIESPRSLEEYGPFALRLRGRFSGIMFRYGEGVDPLLFVSATLTAELGFSLYLHLRDMNRIALSSVLRSAAALNIKLIFLGEPLLIPGVEPIGFSDSIAFLSFARSIVSQDIVFGASNLLANEPDRRLLLRQSESGMRIFAVPPHAVASECLRRPASEIWNRLRPTDGITVKSCADAPILVDFADLGNISYDEIEGRLQEMSL